MSIHPTPRHAHQISTNMNSISIHWRFYAPGRWFQVMLCSASSTYRLVASRWGADNHSIKTVHPLLFFCAAALAACWALLCFRSRKGFPLLPCPAPTVNSSATLITSPSGCKFVPPSERAYLLTFAAQMGWRRPHSAFITRKNTHLDRTYFPGDSPRTRLKP